MKKVLSLVLALVLVLGMIPAFAATATGGQELLANGFITGKPGTTEAEKLDVTSNLKRIELAALVAELKGEKDEAAAMVLPADYADSADIATWAMPYVAYAQMNGWMTGKLHNMFDPNGIVGDKEMAAVLMNVLGYEIAAYSTVVAEAAALGIIVEGAALTRGEVFEAMWFAVSEVPMMGSEMTLGQYLGKLAMPLELVTSVTALTTTIVEVKFGVAVDAVAPTNFTIEGIAVNAATLSTDAMMATLTVAPLTVNTSYELTVTGVKVDAVTQDDVVKTLAVGSIQALYNPTLVVSKEIIKADGASQAIVTFSLKDALGQVITDAKNVEVSFTTTFGQFAQNRVALQNGEAKLLLTSEFLTSDKVADLRAVVIEAQDANLIGLKADAKVIFSPNPEQAAIEALGASLTGAESNQADRVVLYFNKDVKVSDYVYSTVANKGMIDPLKVAIMVETGTSVTTAITTDDVSVVGLMPVAGNSKALQVLLDTPLTDNADVFVSFTDKTGSVDVARIATFKLTDARKPALLSVATTGLKSVVLTFSEPVNYGIALANFTIDGVVVDATTTTTVGVFTPSTGIDQRNIVTITLGIGKYLTAGTHSVQASNVGDWAANSDSPANIMNTQTLDFTIASDTVKPMATVEVMSPEQWLVTYNRIVNEPDLALALEVLTPATTTVAASWAPVATNKPGLLITKIGDSKFLVEVNEDWTKTHNTLVTGKNYFNYSYRLNIAADAVTNVANGLKSDAQLLALGGAMLAPDTTSPVISNIVEVTAGTEYKVVMNEPVKMVGAHGLETDTLAQGQTALPTVTAEFIKSDYSKTISGSVAPAFADAYDKEITVTPATPLEAGTWILVIRSISDDVGNTAASVTKQFTVAAATPTVADGFRVETVIASTTAATATTATANTITVKFNQAFKFSGGITNALATTNYTLDGQALPLGTQITAVTTTTGTVAVVDTVVIALPTVLSLGSHVLNISTTITSATDGALLNGGETLFTNTIN